jgi:arylsulfatase A-like enzyme
MADERPDRPNVVVVMTDQHRADACAREGFELDTTPFLDSLARDGTWFDRAYSPYPMCVPARTSFLTGRFPSWTGVHANDTAVGPRYRTDLFDVMNEQGHETSLCGKNHSYLEPDRADHWYEVSHQGGNPRTESGERWDEWVRGEIHSSRHRLRRRPARRACPILWMLRIVDDQIRRFVEALESAGFRQDTVLVFVSDHGDYMGEYGMMRKTAGVPESLVRIPMFFVGPDVVADPDPHPAHVSLADIMPTLCNVVGAEIPPGVQGRSLLPLLRGDPYPEAEFDSVYTEVGYGGRHTGDDVTVRDPDRAQFHALSGTVRGVRSGDWKLTFDTRGDGRLYDLSADPAETEDHYDDSEYADQRRSLLEELLTWQLRLGALDTPHEVDLTVHPYNYWTVDE